MSEPLLSEWACLGVLYDEPAHGWAVQRELRPTAEVGRIWTVSRPLTYRAIEQLRKRSWLEPVGEEPGAAGPNRVVLKATRSGRHRFRSWLRTPVRHHRDLRSHLLLKMVFSARHGIEIGPMLVEQESLIAEQRTVLEREVSAQPDDVVARWRLEASRAALAFLKQ